MLLVVLINVQNPFQAIMANLGLPSDPDSGLGMVFLVNSASYVSSGARLERVGLGAVNAFCVRKTKLLWPVGSG